MKTILPLTLGLGAALLSPFVHAEEELAPPDVDFYAEAQMLRADLAPYGFDTTDGLDIRLGMWLNSVDIGGNSRLGLEAGFLRHSEDSNGRQFERAPESNETPINGTPIDTVRINEENSLRLNGITVGVVWQTKRWVYLKGGAYIYDFKLENRQQRAFLDDNSDTVASVNEAPTNDSQSGIAPYLGVGLAIPVLDKLSVTADYRQTQLESENYGTFGVGLRFSN
ncbi:hypothetical protein A3717_00555 [Alcanivorax sp. HI0013]|uniref:outer membrane beta-barrel protein n=1 Tax=unclassified Alcanivorax TaxID=2638842 RepID=UPI0007B93CA2|nr:MULTISPECIES: outer membrane beta-barrel protein [unclassified Alcanivorax]KZX62182.1 hypothetical protein A3713_07350 [Alcanivorax sp. HI0003]KZX72047.1 hypothetical protein A3714_00600 [Alcanivorax sp. HI0007]KZX84657.1 hypothetical protein A3717_00555 [Alcanivorax sp. HI0013]KZY07624.1 hypothetical protein A3725_03765 [Alcanivorax sp. HI0035]